MPPRRTAKSFQICSGFGCRKLLTPYIDGELGKDERTRIESHLEKCIRCRAERDRLMFASELVSRLVLPDAPPSGMPIWVAPAQRDLSSSRPASTYTKWSWKMLAPVAAAIILIVTVVALWSGEQSLPDIHPSDSDCEVLRLSGSPLINSNQMGKSDRLKTGDWLETDDKSRALLNLGLTGQVEVDSNSRLQLVALRSSEQRLRMTRGRIFATITAPPQLFFVETPAGLAIDLGCAYFLEVDESGQTFLQVTSGTVALGHNGREVIVPAYAICRAKPDVGPGTPFYDTASKRLQDALGEFDFEGGGSNALEIILKEATSSDSLTLWHLLKRVEGSAREAVYEKLDQFVGPPEAVTKEGALRLDTEMLRLWFEKIERSRANPYANLRPAPGSIKITSTMEADRAVHRATRLSDSRVLITGGLDSYGRVLQTAEVYDATTGAFARVENMNSTRASHSATMLRNGKVLIAGGAATNENNSVLSSAELYDPQTGIFTLTGNLATARAGHEATLLPDGRVLITGGFGSSLDAPYLQSAEIYDPETGAFTRTGKMNDPRVDHTATLLDTGKVLVAGGYAHRGSRNGATSTTELYDPQTGTFSIIAEMNFHRFKHSAVRLSDGRVLIAGGIASYPDAPRPYTTAEIYDPATNSFVKTGDMIVHRFKVKDAAVLLKNGKVLIAGGSWGFEIYDPATGTFSMNTNGLALSRYYSTATLLADGRVLIAGGYSSTQPNDWYHANASAWIYQPE